MPDVLGDEVIWSATCSEEFYAYKEPCSSGSEGEAVSGCWMYVRERCEWSTALEKRRLKRAARSLKSRYEPSKRAMAAQNVLQRIAAFLAWLLASFPLVLCPPIPVPSHQPSLTLDSLAVRMSHSPIPRAHLISVPSSVSSPPSRHSVMVTTIFRRGANPIVLKETLFRSTPRTVALPSTSATPMRTTQTRPARQSVLLQV